MDVGLRKLTSFSICTYNYTGGFEPPVEFAQQITLKGGRHKEPRGKAERILLSPYKTIYGDSRFQFQKFTKALNTNDTEESRFPKHLTTTTLTLDNNSNIKHYFVCSFSSFFFNSLSSIFSQTCRSTNFLTISCTASESALCSLIRP